MATNSDGPETMRSMFDDLLSHELSAGASCAMSAGRAWHQANGDFEHRHTCGVFLKDMSEQGLEPILFVYIDSNVIMQDFTTNREVYLLRLRNIGFAVSDVQFRLSKYKRPRAAEKGAASPAATKPALPEATAAEIAWAQGATAKLPDGLREKVCKAMISSARRQRAKGSQTGELAP